MIGENETQAESLRMVQMKSTRLLELYIQLDDKLTQRLKKHYTPDID